MTPSAHATKTFRLPSRINCRNLWSRRAATQAECVRVPHIVRKTLASNRTPLKPLGVAATCRPPAEIAKLLETPTGRTGACIFGGAFDMLALHTVALAGGLDTGRMSLQLSKITEVCDIPVILGPIEVNMSVYLDGASSAKLVRCHKDAEVAVVALLLYWHKDDGRVLTAMWNALSDVVFDGRAYGTGAAFKIKQFASCQDEEAMRDVIGISAFRKCIVLADIADAIAQEGSLTGADKEAEKMETLFKKISPTSFSTWSAETVKRFLSVGRRLKGNVAIMELMQQWEVTYKRNTYVDAITNLRAAVSASSTDADSLPCFLS